MPVRFLLIAALLAGFLASPLAAKADGKMPPPQPLESAYVGLALDFGAPEICAKISPRAREYVHGNPRGLQYFLTRSMCYQNLAQKLGEPALCNEVVGLGSNWFSSGASISFESCHRLATAGAGFAPMAEFDAGLILEAAGYAMPKDATASEAMESYFELKRSGGDAFLNALVEKLPDFSAPGH